MKERVLILGGGPAGLGAAWQLAQRGRAEAEVFEARERVGGNAASFDVAGAPVDYGSHRLHPSCDPDILADLRRLLGDDLLDRPRHGRIRLHRRWVHFPIAAVDAMRNLPWSFRLGVARDAVAKHLHREPAEETFASVLEQGLGRTICHDFYFPYARKIWGLAPEELSAVQARRRVSAGSLGKMIGKVARAALGRGGSRFFYPREGFGQISTALAEAVERSGSAIHLGARVVRVELGETCRVTVASDDGERVHEGTRVWSTIPISVLPRLLQPAAPDDVIAACDALTTRAMVLVYLVLEQEQFTEFDAHYFPETSVRISRLSEPKNYRDDGRPPGRTVLCAELPCRRDDEVFSADEEALGDLVRRDLEHSDLPIRSEVSSVVVRRIPNAYPVYRQGYEEPFERVDGYLRGLDRLLVYGRQGLFAHDNTHHGLAMAYAAVSCMGPTGFDQARWSRYREEFESHVVED